MSKTSPVWPAKAALDWPRMATEHGVACGVSLSGYSLSLSSFSWAKLILVSLYSWRPLVGARPFLLRSNAAAVP